MEYLDRKYDLGYYYTYECRQGNSFYRVGSFEAIGSPC